jgi:hypothetical protein
MYLFGANAPSNSPLLYDSSNHSDMNVEAGNCLLAKREESSTEFRYITYAVAFSLIFLHCAVRDVAEA